MTNHLLERTGNHTAPTKRARKTGQPADGAANGSLPMVSAVGRWPGGSGTSQDRLLSAAGDTIGAVPVQRWSERSYIATGVALSAKQLSCVRHGGFVAEAQRFDALAFNVSTMEASMMDPQQRLLLEYGYETLHLSGESRSTLLGASTATLLGIERPDWVELCASKRRASGSSHTSSPYDATSSAPSIAAGRISYILGLQGTSCAVDSACSSALVALHMAGEAASRTDCHGALSSSVGLKLHPGFTLDAAAAGMLSIDGRCKTFDKNANGYARSEGIGALVLSRTRAQECASSDVDFALGGSAVRQDGRSASLTAPSGKAQRVLIEATLEVAMLDAHELRRIETHGTGTPLGDPTEVGALSAVMQASKAPSSPAGRERIDAHTTAIGASKANSGHTEAPAGQFGLMRAMDLLRSGEGAPNAKLRLVNPVVLQSQTGAKLMMPAQLLPPNTLRFDPAVARGIGVSSFGFSGTIAHSVATSELRPSGGGKRFAHCGGAREIARFARCSFPWHEGDKDLTPHFYSTAWSRLDERSLAGHGGADAPALLISRPAEFAGMRIRKAVDAPPPRKLAGVVLLLPTAASAAPGRLASFVAAAQNLITLLPAVTRMTVLTSASHAAPERSSAPAASGSANGVTGAVRAMRLEITGLRTTILTQQAVAKGGDTAAALATMAVADGLFAEEMELARCCTAGGSFVGMRLRRGAQLSLQKRGRRQASGASLITGGLGGLGLQAAKMLIKSRFANSVTLTSRSGCVARNEPCLSEQLVNLQNEVTVPVALRTCNVADAADTLHAMRATGVTPAGLHVLHAAGGLCDGLLRSMTAASIATVYAPKARGAWHLQDANARGTLLRSFVMFSSDASCIGNAGQGNYAAANAYLDSLASRRQLDGLVACALQLPLISGAGMGAAAVASGSVSKDTLGLSLELYAKCLETCLDPFTDVSAAGVQMPFLDVSLWTRVPDTLRLQARFEELKKTNADVATPGLHVAPAVCSRRVTGEDVLAVVGSFSRLPDGATATTSLLELELDSLAMSALAAALSTKVLRCRSNQAVTEPRTAA